MRPADSTLRPAVRCSGHIDPRVELYRDNPAGVIKLMAINVLFLAMPAIARIRLIRHTLRQIFQYSISLRMNRPESATLFGNGVKRWRLLQRIAIHNLPRWLPTTHQTPFVAGRVGGASTEEAKTWSKLC